MEYKINRFVYWTPRILSILFLLFLTIFSFDVFGEGYSFWEVVVAFLMHNIPVFILAIVLWISWKREWVGGSVFILAGLLYIIFPARNAPTWYWALVWILMISGPAFLIGVLFLANWRIRSGARKPYRSFRKR